MGVEFPEKKRYVPREILMAPKLRQIQDLTRCQGVKDRECHHNRLRKVEDRGPSDRHRMCQNESGINGERNIN